jgi:hypothetical protein
VDQEVSFCTPAGSTQFNALPDKTERDKTIKDKVRECFAKGKITRPEEIVATARKIKSQALKKESLPADLPDLIDVMRGWTERAGRWAEQLEQVKPYIDYIDREPEAARRWREAAKNLIDKLQEVI